MALPPARLLRRTRLFRAGRALVAACAMSAGCMPIPVTLYVPVVSAGQLVHATCAPNQHLPVGARLPVGGAWVTVRVARHEGRHFVELQFDVPEEEVLRLDSDEVRLVRPAGDTVTARFPSISLVDTPIVNSFSTAPALRALQLPALASMPGGRTAAGGARHYWLATPVDAQGEASFDLVLAPVRDRAGQVHRFRLRFESRTLVGFAVLNC